MGKIKVTKTHTVRGRRVGSTGKKGCRRSSRKK